MQDSKRPALGLISHGPLADLETLCEYIVITGTSCNREALQIVPFVRVPPQAPSCYRGRLLIKTCQITMMCTMPSLESIEPWSMGLYLVRSNCSP